MWRFISILCFFKKVKIQKILMKRNSLFFLTTIVLLSGVLPAFAEVAELQLDKNSK